MLFSIYYLIGYFDLGFTSASLKFYSENLNNNSKENLQILGYIFFIFIFIGAVFSIGFLIIANSNLISNDIPPENINVFRAMSVLCAIFSFSIAFKKVGDVHFAATVQTYIQQRCIALASILKIFACLICFVIYDYQIIEYFFTFLLIDFLVNVYLFIRVIGPKNLVTFLFKHVRFKRKIFDEQKSLAFTTVVGAIVGIICFESDVIIGNLILDIDVIYLISAVYFLVTPIKRFISILFIPLFPRLNHFYGENDLLAVNKLFNSTMRLMTLISPFFAIIYVLSYDAIYLIYGEDFKASINLFNICVFTYFFIFLSNPVISILRTYLEIKNLITVNIMQIFIFILVLLCSYEFIGIYSIFVAKFTSTLIAVMQMSLMAYKINNKIIKLIFHNILSLLLTILLYYMFSYLISTNIFYFGFSIEKYLSLFLSLAIIYMFLFFRNDLIKQFLVNYNSNKR